MEDKNMNLSVVKIEGSVGRMLEAVKDLSVSDQESYDQAVLVGKKVSALLKLIDDEEKAITKPINDSLKLIRAKYKPFKDRVEEVKTSIKQKMEMWFRAEEARRAKEEARIAARVEKGTLKEETAIAKLSSMQTAESSGAMTSILIVDVIDIKSVPAEYLLIDEAKVKAAFREGKEIAGVKCFYEKRARL